MDRIRRVYHPSVEGSDTLILLEPDEARHVARVLRLRTGDSVSVFDGRGREWSGTLIASRPSTVRVKVGEERHDPVEPDLEVVLYQGLCRPDRLDWVIQKGTEIGFSGFRIVEDARSQIPPPSPSRFARWNRVALEACKQSGRRRLPEVTGPLARPPVPEEGALGLLLEANHRQARPLGEVLTGPRPERVWLAVGPEWGFDPQEVRAMTASGWISCALGPRTLRTETAGMIAGGVVLHAWGDLGSPRVDSVPPAP